MAFQRFRVHRRGLSSPVQKGHVLRKSTRPPPRWKRTATQVQHRKGHVPYWNVLRDASNKLEKPPNLPKCSYGNCGTRKIMTQMTRKWLVKLLIFLRKKRAGTSKDLQSELAKDKGVRTLRVASTKPLLWFFVPYWGFPPNAKLFVTARRPVFYRAERTSRYAGIPHYESNCAPRIVFYHSKPSLRNVGEFLIIK